MEEKNNIEESFETSPLEYSVGEVCNCYYTEIVKNKCENITQQINKCSCYGRIVEKNMDDKKSYTVVLFDGKNTKKRLPGCCLRKTKILSYTKNDAVSILGKTIQTQDGSEIMLVVSVVDDTNGVRINDIDSKIILDDFVFSDTGAPCGKIVMLKADEAFANFQ